jgi:hypothetical protein
MAYRPSFRHAPSPLETFFIADAITQHTHGRGLTHQFESKLIVKIDDRRAQTRPAKELFLGGGIGFHAAVVVEMIACEVGEYRDINPGTVHAPFLDADRAGLERTGLSTGLAESGEQAHQRGRFGCRESGFLQIVRKAGSQRADDSAAARVGTGDNWLTVVLPLVPVTAISDSPALGCP